MFRGMSNWPLSRIMGPVEEDVDLIRSTTDLFTAAADYIHILETSICGDAFTYLPSTRNMPETGVQNTCQLVKSQFAQTTSMASGFGTMKRKWSRNNIVNMVLAREKGQSVHANFSYADKCRLNNQYLPNEMEGIQWHDGKVFCGTFSKNGDYFMTASQDRLINIHDTKDSYKVINEIQTPDVEWSIIDVAFSPDGQHIVYSTWNPLLRLCSIHSDSDKQEVLELTNTAGRFCAFSVIFSSGGDEIFTGASDGCIYIYDMEKRQRSSRIVAHEYDANAIALASESSQIIYSGGDDGLIKVWDRRALNESFPRPVGVLAGHMDGITYIDSRGDGQHLISNSKDQSIKLWDIRAFSSCKAAENTIKMVQSHSWDYRWQNVPRKLYKDKRVEGDTSVMTYKGHIVIKTLIRCKFSPLATTGQRYIYTGCGKGRIVVYDSLTGKMQRVLEGHSATVRDVSWHPNRNEILSSGWDGLVGCWTYRSPENIPEEDIEFPMKCKQPKLRKSERLLERRRRNS